jgi:hypothetical protein
MLNKQYVKHSVTLQSKEYYLLVSIRDGFWLGFSFNTEEGSEILIQSVGWLS